MSLPASPVAGIYEFAASRDILVDYRFIEDGDERHLLPEETHLFGRATLAAQRQSGAARMVARTLLARLGVPPCPILKGEAGAPVWPAGVVGSLAHESSVAVAALARDKGGSSIGIDIEPNEPLPPEMAALVATPTEQAKYGNSVLLSRRLFVIKEAVYKAAFPIEKSFLDFADIEVDLEKGVALTRRGTSVNIYLAAGHYLSALAIIGW